LSSSRSPSPSSSSSNGSDEKNPFASVRVHINHFDWIT
jgi:hypothetical protein